MRYTTRAFCDAYIIRGTCPQEGAIHFPRNISAREGFLDFKILYSLVWGSLRSPNQRLKKQSLNLFTLSTHITTDLNN